MASPEGPEVFGPHTLTVVHGAGGISVYAGAVRLTMAEDVVGRGPGTTVRFRRIESAGELLKLDEEVRAVVACGFCAVPAA